ncbi:ea3d2b18-cb24-4b93-b1b5-6dacfd42c220 [Sclerotinia trifoliorum]|uniref:Ea3d2b18-cb24-4b93-b1b5-6dacfd42c220 n=1 Tax=Sclerotinia trifoliorum TaxID=28548 RepID=A0A8H2ZRP3_9HELO|nr:ea3d2b18-cb24-4b93-b1b5-6dacfd42c220 [Sclerotinia trifoliorum]
MSSVNPGKMTRLETLSPNSEKSSFSTGTENSPDPCEVDLNHSKAAGFTFIQVSNGRGPRTEARSHVMREFWREKKLQNAKKAREHRKKDSCSLRPRISKRRDLQDTARHHSNSRNPEDCVESDIDNEESDEGSAREAPRTKMAQETPQTLSGNLNTLPDQFSNYGQTIIPLCRTGIANADPFSRLKLGEGPEIQRLIHHYCWITASCMDQETTGTDFGRVGWLYSRVSWLDPEPAHIVMGFNIQHMARLHGQKEPPIAIKHKTEAMRVINKRLNDPAQALSDGSIGAVANFTGHELLSGLPENFSIHMNGLDQMVKCRGGLVAFSRNRPLQLVIESLDLCRAYIQISRPIYSRCDKNVIEELTTTSSLGASTLQYQIAEMQAKNNFCTDFIRMVYGLERATGIIKDEAPKTTSPEQWNNFSDRICSAAIGMSWLHSTERATDERRSIMWKCFRLASLIYLQMALQEFNTTPQLREKYFQACRYRLLDTTSGWGRAIEMLARVILQGERSNVERHRRAWYVANAMIELQGIGLDTWKKVEGTLFTYLGSSSGKTEGKSTPLTVALRGNLDICSEDFNLNGGAGWLGSPL